MAAGSSGLLWPVNVDQWGPCVRSVSGLHRLLEVSPSPEVIGAGREPEDRLLVRMMEAHSSSRLHRLPEVRV